VRNSSNNEISACSSIVNNQTAPYTFMNGTYNFLTSSTSSTVIGPDLVLTFYGDSVPVTFLGPANYNNAGTYIGSVTTNVSGTNISGEWIQIQLPYTLYVTTYSVNGNVGGGGNWIPCWPKSFYLCGSNDGTTWSTVDNKSGLTCNANLLNYFTAPTQLQGYRYFRLIGQQVGTYTNTFGKRMGVCVGIQGTYRG
jgi:hypothetical protein